MVSRRPPSPGTAHRDAPPAGGSLSIAQGAALTIGAVLGTGVITLPAAGAAVAGPASILAWVLLVALSVPLAATFAALGARYPDRGGVATYVGQAFGPRLGAIVGWCFYLAVPVGAPAAAMMGGRYVADVAGGGRQLTLIVAGVIIVIVGLMNVVGLRLSGRLQLGLAALLTALIVMTVAVALPHARPEAIGPIAPHGWWAVGPAAGLLVWGFAGWEALSSLAGEYRDPVHDVPRATAAAVAVVGVLYLALAVSTVLVLGPAAGTSRAPLSDLMALGLGESARYVTAALAVLLTIGAMNAYFAGSARLGAALARDGAMPAWLAHGNRPGERPQRSLGVVVALSLTALGGTAATGLELEPLLLLTTGSFTVVYILGTAAGVRLLPAGSWVRRGAVMALISVLILGFMIGWASLWAVGVCLAAAVYLWWRERGRPDSGGSAHSPRPAQPSRASRPMPKPQLPVIE